ncbi:RIB43A_domain-containing protein [Hexamita inflata]|uniref:RIB43A_domain-containing protein n=1 Tax=Hexamita inflata TaxID=28002 RepID=A0ABP1HAN1_9EUKA
MIKPDIIRIDIRFIRSININQVQQLIGVIQCNKFYFQLTFITHVKDATEKLTKQVRRHERIQTAQENMQMAEMKQTMRTATRKGPRGTTSRRIMQEVARPGIRDEFKGFDAETVKSYNESILQQMKEAEAKKALRRQEQIEIERKELEVNRQLQINEMEQKRAIMNMQSELAEEQRQNGQTACEPTPSLQPC